MRCTTALTHHVDLCTCAHPSAEGWNMVLAAPPWTLLADASYSAAELVFGLISNLISPDLPACRAIFVA